MSYLRCEQTALSCGPRVLPCLQCRLPSSCTGANGNGLEILQSPVSSQTLLTPSRMAPPSADVGQGCEQTPLFSPCFILTPALQMKEVDRTQVDAWPGVRHGASGCGCKRLTRGHLVCTSKSTSESMREGSRTPATVWKPGTCSCSWIWSLRRRISRRCISMILPVSSCSLSLIVGPTLAMSLVSAVRDKAGSLWPSTILLQSLPQSLPAPNTHGASTRGDTACVHAASLTCPCPCASPRSSATPLGTTLESELLVKMVLLDTDSSPPFVWHLLMLPAPWILPSSLSWGLPLPWTYGLERLWLISGLGLKGLDSRQ